MNSASDTCRNVPYVRSPIDFGRRRQIPLAIRKINSTLRKISLSENGESSPIFLLKTKAKEPIHIFIQK
jgi:hypothetical protein